MKMHVARNHPAGRLTVLAASLAGLLTGLSAPALAAPADVVISQYYGGAGSGGALWNKDFVELFNRSSAPVNLSGWSVQYQSAAGTSWAVIAATNTVLQPGQYYLVTAQTAATGSDVGPGDASGGLALSATTGKVALASVARAMSTPEGEAVIDMVGFGTANRFEGSSVAPAPSTVNSIQRGELGCLDTDNNGNDFSAAQVTGPRRASSPLNACNSGPVVYQIVTSCPAGVQAEFGSGAIAALSASDRDSIVNSAVIASGAVPGISIGSFTAAGAVGGTANATLNIAPSLAAGNYPLTITFANNDGQDASCNVAVSVAGQLTIPQIQGPNPKSAYNNTVQTTQGVVTHKVGSGYFLQDANGDGDPATSDGIFVFANNANVNVGDLVRITGTVTEYTPSGAARSYTEFKDLSATTKLGVGYSVAPTNIELPTDLARVEGMLVRFTTALTVNGNAYLGDRGELVLSNGRREIPTNRYPAGSPEAIALAQANAANVIVLDDNIFTTPATIPYLAADGTVRSGDTVTDLTGVIDFGAQGGGGAAFKLQPTVAPTFSRTNERTPAPVLAAGNVKVASANVLNFFTTFTNGGDAWGRTGQGCTLGGTTRASNCRGADNLAEFVRQRDKIVESLGAINADVVGLMEIENNGDTTTSYLVEQLNAKLGAGTYAVVPKPATTGTDAIRVAMIYKPGAVSLVGNALSDGDAVNNRPPIAQTFKATNGGKFSLVVNHLKSKGSCGGGAGNTDSGDGQGCWNATRVEQAARLRDYFLPLVANAANDSDILVVGDMNAYGHEDPIRLLNAAGYVNEIERFVRAQGIPYSYVFGAESGYLDHALASSSLSGQVAGVSEWHNNADEPDAIDYNLNDTAEDPYVRNPYRASDHDPVVVSLNLAPTYADVTASVALTKSSIVVNRVTGKYSGSVTVKNTSGAAISGPLHLVLQGLPGGVTLDNKSGVVGGAPYITLANTTLAPGASVTVTTTFTNPSKVGIGYNAKLLSGSF